jgi:hypothetical protein
MTSPTRSGYWPWPGLVLALLGMQILLCLVAIVLAVRAPGGEVVPDYHRKSLEWDRQRAPPTAPESTGRGS